MYVSLGEIRPQRRSWSSADPGPTPMARILCRFDPTLTPALGVVLGFGLGPALDWDRQRSLMHAGRRSEADSDADALADAFNAAVAS